MAELRASSAWDEQGIGSFLHECVIPIRLGCITGDGSPLICSLWYLYDDGALWCATQETASVVTLLKNKPHCGFEVAPETMPYRGVRGQGRVTLSANDGPEILLRLIDRYLGTRESGFASWLIDRSATEVAIRIEPDWLTSWDFSSRMQPDDA